MKRGPGPSRSSGLRRTTRLAPSRKPIRPNKTRKAANFERAYGGAEYRAYVVSLPCLVCGRTPSDPAHTKNGGGSRKGDAGTLVPLCPTNVPEGWLGHHAEYDTGKRSFAAKYGLDLAACASETERRWRETL